MSTIDLKNKIIDKLNTIEDATFLESVLLYLEKAKTISKTSNLSEIQMNELNKRSADYLAGKAKTTSWEEIKLAIK